MSTKTKQLTDQELQQRLEDSSLELEQKLHLMPLISIMSKKDKDHLIHLIDKSNSIQEKNKANNEDFAKLNKECTQQMNKLIKSEHKLARKEFEKLTAKREGKELEDLMKNI